MSADYPSSPAEPEPASAAGSSATAPAVEPPKEFPRQKRRHRRDDGPAGSHEQQIIVLSSLLANLMEKRGEQEAAFKAEKVYRFFRATAKSTGEAGSDFAAVGTSSPALSTPASGSSPANAARLVTKGKAPAWRGQSDSRSRSKIPGFWYWGLLLLVGLAAYAGGRRTFLASSKQADTLTDAGSQTPTWSLEDLTKLDGILEADQAGDLEKAARLGDELKAKAGSLPGLDAYLNLILARRQKLPDAQSTLTRTLSPTMVGLQLASMDNALAFTFTRERRFPMATKNFQQSSLADPFSAETFRRLGESLRRQGRQDQAIAAFHQALARYPIGPVEYMDAREYVKYKIRLAQVEGNLPLDTRTADADGEATGNSAGYWFLTDAALALQKGNPDAGAAALQRAKGAVPAALFQALLGDYFFRAFVTAPQLAAFFPADVDAKAKLRSRMVYFIDP